MLRIVHDIAPNRTPTPERKKKKKKTKYKKTVDAEIVKIKY